MAASTTNEIFGEAHKEFLRQLAPEQCALYSSCASADQLLADARQLQIIAKDRVRGRGFFERIKAFSDKLEPYFKVVEIMIQAKPEAAALVWGSIRLVLELAGNYATFFDKLTRTLERLAHHVPQYELIVRLYKGRHPDELTNGIEASLRAVYVDIFEFLQRVTRVFARKHGKYKHRPVVMVGLAWQPFDSQFDEILKRMEVHRDLLKEQLDLDQLRLSIEEHNEHAKFREDELKRLESQDSAMQNEKIIEDLRHKIQELIDLKRARESELQGLLHKHKMKEMQEAARQEMLAERLEEERRAHKDTKSERKELEELHREGLIARIREWLSPPEFQQEFEKALEARENGTAEWLLEEPAFKTWERSKSLRSKPFKFQGECLWVQGNPGYGKTVLAAAAVNSLRDNLEAYQRQSSTQDSEVLYYFFRAGITTMNSISAAYRSLLAQALQKHREDEDIIDQFVFAMDQASGGQLVATKDELQELLRIFANCSGLRCYFVLDGIDECIENSSLVQELLKLKQDSDARLLLFSRPTVAPLLRAVPLDQQLPIGRKTTEDIQVYLERNLNHLQLDGSLPETIDMEDLVGHLVTGADGMFLWARLMISYLDCPALTRSQRVEVIRNVILPEGLETMYERIGKMIGQGYEIEQRLAKSIILWLTFTERRLTAREVQAAISSTDDSRGSLYAKEDLKEFIHIVKVTCAGLVEIEEIYSPLHEQLSTFFRFIHLSAQEYFATLENRPKSSSDSIISVKSWESHIEITRSCLHFLTFTMPAQPLGGNVGMSITRQRLNYVFPFSSYAALYWIHHLQATEFDYSKAVRSNNLDIHDQLGPLFTTISQFLSQKFVLTSWIEATYVCGQQPLFESLQRWATWATQLQELQTLQDFDVSSLRQDILELCRYIKELGEVWGPKLMATPGCIWEEVTAFSPCRLLPQTTATKVHSLVGDEPQSDYLSSKSLCKISESSQDGLILGVLSIWPSREYELFTKKEKKNISLKILRDLASGWIARYEIWSLAAEPVRTIDHKISLDSTEVWLQMKQTLCQKSASSEGWGMQFPTKISKTVRMFSILRTVYSLKSTISERGVILQATTLDMSIDGFTSPHWSASHDGVLDNNSKFRSDRLEADERFERRELYLYWLFFHRDDRTILFVCQDLQSQSIATAYTIQHSPELTASASALGRLKAEASLISHQEWSRDFNQVRMTYHPHVLLVAFTFAGLLYLWTFGNPAAKPSRLCSIHAQNPRIWISSCGKYICFTEQDEQSFTKRPIPPEFLQVPRKVLTVSPATSEKGTTSLVETTKWFSYAPAGSGKDSLSPSRFRDDQALLKSFRSRDNRLHVLALQKDNHQDPHASQELAKLPSWAGDGAANIEVTVPEDRQEMINIILNKAAKPWYGMTEPADTHLPAFVQRDQRSLDPGGLTIQEPPRSRSALGIERMASEDHASFWPSDDGE